MHARGVAHRDIKPSNIMLDDNCMPILIDFGCANHLDIKSGTPHYYAPE
jgi:serine/threonine protein kinase